MAQKKLDPKAAKHAVASVQDELEALDQDTVGTVVGVSQAINELTTALEDVDARIHERKYADAAALGYGSVSENFVFLQRTLGDLSGIDDRKAEIVQRLAQQLKCAYEAIEPYVNAALDTMQPRQPIGVEDIKRREKMLERVRSKRGNPRAAARENESREGAVFNVDRATGFGSEGWRKATALAKAVETTKSSEERRISLPAPVWAQLDRESDRLGVTIDELMHAALANWLETNPKRVKG